jgi:predicted small lipoprotein YifL
LTFPEVPIVTCLYRALLLVALALGAGCGQLGPLYPAPPAEDATEAES